jgi:hypothetical protein
MKKGGEEPNERCEGAKEVQLIQRSRKNERCQRCQNTKENKQEFIKK